MWVVTKAINEYNQDGDYLIAVYDHKPSFQELKTLLPNETDVTIGKLTRGGDRQNQEYEWYYLKELQSGEKYE